MSKLFRIGQCAGEIQQHPRGHHGKFLTRAEYFLWLGCVPRLRAFDIWHRTTYKWQWREGPKLDSLESSNLLDWNVRRRSEPLCQMAEFYGGFAYVAAGEQRDAKNVP